MRQILNNTNIPQLIVDIGVSIPPGLYTIPPEKYWYFASSSNIDTFIDSNNFTIVEDGLNLNAYDGKRLIHTGTDYLIVQRDNPSIQNVTYTTEKLRFSGPEFTLSSPEPGTSIVTLNSSATQNGRTFQYDFVEDSDLDDDWMYYSAKIKRSDEVPAVFPVNCKLVSLTFTNKEENAYTYIRIHKNGTNNASLVYEWPISNRIVAWKTSNLSSFNFDTGDRLRVYGRKRSGFQKPKEVIVTLTFVATDNLTSEGGFSSL